jgi:GntR family transcriptional repressor for pyruvate dehydrogenase complex
MIDAIPQISKTSRLDDAVAIITGLITSGQIPSGDLLPSEAELCRRMGVSRATVREALRKLEAQGLVMSQHGVGVRVVDHTSKVAADSILMLLKRRGVGTRDMLEVRLILEGQGTALAAERATPEDIAAIRDAIDEMARQPRPTSENVRLDLDFHLRVAEASHNLVLIALVDAIRDLLYEVISLTHSDNPDVGTRIAHHTAVLRGIERHDPEIAAKAMTEHLNATRWMVDTIQAGKTETRPQGRSEREGA